MGAAKNNKKNDSPLLRHILRWNVSASYSRRAGHTDYFAFPFLSPFVHASIHEFSRRLRPRRTAFYKRNPLVCIKLSKT